MKMILSLIVFAAIGFASKFVYQKYFVGEACKPPAGMECGSLQHLRHVSREVSQGLPVHIDTDVKLNRVWARESEIVYDAQLVNYKSSQIDREKFETAFFVELRKFFCKSREGRMFRKHGITATFQVTGKDGFNIGTVSVGSADCKWT